MQFAPTATGAVTASLKATSKKSAATATDSLSATGTFPSLAGETLTLSPGASSTFTGTCDGENGSFRFSVSGTAVGPFPGTFTETGGFVLDDRPAPSNQSEFSSTFTITSGSITITGTNSEVGPAGFSKDSSCMPDATDHASANATVQAATLSDTGGDAGAATITISGDTVPSETPPPQQVASFSEAFGSGGSGRTTTN